MAIPQLPKEYDQLDQWTTLMFLYKSALQEVQTRINILSEEFQQINHYNPCLLYTSLWGWKPILFYYAAGDEPLPDAVPSGCHERAVES